MIITCIIPNTDQVIKSMVQLKGRLNQNLAIKDPRSCFLGSGPKGDKVLLNTGGLCLSVHLFIHPPQALSSLLKPKICFLRPEIRLLRPKICPLRPVICPQ